MVLPSHGRWKNSAGSLIGTKLVPKGRVGHQTMKETAGSISDENASLLREHPQQWIDAKLVPSLIDDLIKKGATPAQAQAKTLDPAWVSTQMGRMFSDRTAQEMATLMVLQRNGNQQFLKDWASLSGDLRVQREATKNSVIASRLITGRIPELPTRRVTQGDGRARGDRQARHAAAATGAVGAARCGRRAAADWWRD